MDNYYEEFENFKEEQTKLNKNAHLNPEWKGWGSLFLAYRLDMIMEKKK